MSGCLEMVSQDVLNAVNSSINESNSTETAWLSSLTATPVMLEEELGSVSTISPSDLSAARQEDGTISDCFVLHAEPKTPHLPGKAARDSGCTTAFT